LQKLGYKFRTLKDAIAQHAGKHAVITFDDGYSENISDAMRVLKKFSAPATMFVITEDIGKKDVVWSEAGEDLPSDILTWEELAKLRQNGWEIGSHAHRHVHLARYSKDEQEDLIARSVIQIEENLGERPVSFAYPYGSYDSRTKTALKKLGIQFAVTINPARFEDDLTVRDYLELTRLSVGGRRFYHYVKAFLRTMKAAVGFQPLRVFAPHPDLRIHPK
jgi:peptidoglycan/xylan/chitin deacetylase (PgdA/CDA1 family)